MTTYSLDTEVVQDLLSGHAVVRRHFEEALSSGSELRICATVLNELACAARGCDEPHKRLNAISTLLSDIEVEPFTGEDAMTASSAASDYFEERWKDPPGVVRAAGQAINNGWVLATSNAFSVYPIKGLRVVDWSRSEAQVNNIHDAVAEMLAKRTKDK